MTFAEFFAGIGGFRLGLERAGMGCVWANELDDYACRVYRARERGDNGVGFPSAPGASVLVQADINGIDPATIPPADVWCGGFPCQDISQAGKRKGIHGERSGLWWAWLKLVCVVRPRILFLENVSGLLAAGRGMDAVLGSLAESGYDAEWDCIPASAVGASQPRRRVFILAYDAGERLPTDLLASCSHDQSGREAEPKRWVRQPQRLCGRLGNTPFPPGFVDEGWTRAVQEGWETPVVERGLCGTDVRFSTWLDRLRCLGNAVVPQVVEWIGRRIGCLGDS